MKKFFVKIMVILVFLACLSINSSTQAKTAPPEYPYQTWICCPDGNCYCCLITYPGEESVYYALKCGCTGDPDTPDD